MPYIAGVDGCPAGWIVVLVEIHEAVVREEALLFGSFEEVLSASPRPAVIAVDSPIGLLERREAGGRQCDREARRVLGKPRSSSIFSPPPRPALTVGDFTEAAVWGLNRQSFGIMGKVRELDDIMTPERQSLVHEVHPEVTFFVMDGLVPMAEGKRSRSGREARRAILGRYFYQVDEMLGKYPRRSVGSDDVLDAYAAAWTAMRIYRKEAGRIPDDPPRDEKGLEMAIWY